MNEMKNHLKAKGIAIPRKNMLVAIATTIVNDMSEIVETEVVASPKAQDGEGGEDGKDGEDGARTVRPLQFRRWFRLHTNLHSIRKPQCQHLCPTTAQSWLACGRFKRRFLGVHDLN